MEWLKLFCLAMIISAMFGVSHALPTVENLTIMPGTSIPIGTPFSISVDAAPDDATNSSIGHVELYYYGINISGKADMNYQANNTWNSSVYAVIPAGHYNILVNAVAEDNMSADVTGSLEITQETQEDFTSVFIVLISFCLAIALTFFIFKSKN